MPAREQLLEEFERYRAYYAQQRQEAGVPSIFEVWWAAHISALRMLNAEQMDPCLTDWIRDPTLSRYYSPELVYKRMVDEMSVCRSCELSGTRTKVVPGDGPLRANVMIVGEAPGADEDATGIPFVGAAGKKLFEDMLLKERNWPRNRIFVANCLKCRPPGNREPKAEEIAACQHFLKRQVALVNPKVILAAGKHAASWFLPDFKSSDKLEQVLDKVHWYGHVPVIIMPHPSAVMRQEHAQEKKPYDYHQKALDAIDRAGTIVQQDFKSEFWTR
jgi:uracil-DNA glycosylase family 4